MKHKNAQGLPVNIIVMVILGLVIFGMGLALFSKFFGEGEDVVDDLAAKVKTGIADLECGGDEWICSPRNSMGSGENKDFWIYIANRGDTNGDFKIELTLESVAGGGYDGKSKSCGDLIISYPDLEINIKSGESAALPFKAISTHISDTPCSFIIPATITRTDHGEGDEENTAVIVAVE